MVRAIIVLYLVLLAARVSAEQLALEPRPDQDAEVQAYLRAELRTWIGTYRQLHSHPELSLHEEQTAKLVADELARAGYTVAAGVGGFGVVGVLRNGKGPTLLLRGDMDALPIAEQTGLPFASRVTTKDAQGQTVPVMHACGHDLHVTNLLATAAVLVKLRAAWAGTLVVVAQPAEEIGEGSLRMIEAGLFERFPKPDYALALHVDPELPVGQVAAISGWAAANADAVDIVVHGRGGHGARPQNAVDPIVASAHLVTALQTVVSRRHDPQSPAVITVGSIHGGTKRNVIPDSVRLELTVRSYSDESRNALLGDIEQLTRDMAKAFRAPRAPEIAVKKDYTPAVYNDPELTREALRVLSEVLGGAAIGHVPPTMGAEDFGRFGKQLRIPSLLLRLGATRADTFAASRRPGAEPPPGLHSAQFAPDAAAAMNTGVRALTSLSLALLPRRAAPAKAP